MMNEIVWQAEHSVESDATPSFAWSFLTDPRNWDDPPAQFELDGPFAPGSEGRTLMPGQEPVRWRIHDVRVGRSYVLQTELDRATLAFEWCFEAVAGCRTKLTQRVMLFGDNAGKLRAGIEEGFGASLPAGMERIAAAVAAAQEATERADE